MRLGVNAYYAISVCRMKPNSNSSCMFQVSVVGVMAVSAAKGRSAIGCHSQLPRRLPVSELVDRVERQRAGGARAAKLAAAASRSLDSQT
jgi:hypothetical protein